ncbi:hypothetical protein Zmor_027764 [Zophobas morio]|uniref:Cytochrome P450 n=1 Tax=Zophobas morio TaxID=2755281 RepID=A0AA38HNS9_9CUCU|nr:hypothetical protein Zmor_027764 [Zophobas morio]
MITITFVVFLIAVIYYLVHLNHQHWKKRGINGPQPIFLAGNMGRSILLQIQPGEIFTDIYRKYNNESIVGAFKSFTPFLLIRDPDLIKEITIKSFSHFRDNDVEIDKKVDPIFGRNPFVLKGEEWKVVRAQLTPAFTSGKMKWLYPSWENNSSKMVQFLEQRPNATNGNGYEAKELCTRFTLNNVGDSVFGIDAKCFDEDNSEFRQLAKDFFTPGSWTIITILIANIFPFVMKILPIRFCPKSVEKKLTQIVSQTLQYREDNNIVRNDFLQIIRELKKTSKDYEFTDLDVTAHAAGFFGDGYETSSQVMSFVLYHLAANEDVQMKLRNEINEAFDEKERLPYEVLQTLTYLDGVFNETLRLTPPVFFLQKMCTEDFSYVSKDSKSVLIEKGTPIVLPIYGLQTDPQYFEDPESFKPERFLAENKERVKKCTFMPFGEGPRACLGQRFGALQVKVGVSYLIKNFELRLNKKTQVPLKFDPANVLVAPVGGLWIDFKKIA